MRARRPRSQGRMRARRPRSQGQMRARRPRSQGQMRARRPRSQGQMRARRPRSQGQMRARRPRSQGQMRARRPRSQGQMRARRPRSQGRMRARRPRSQGRMRARRPRSQGQMRARRPRARVAPHGFPGAEAAFRHSRLIACARVDQGAVRQPPRRGSCCPHGLQMEPLHRGRRRRAAGVGGGYGLPHSRAVTACGQGPRRALRSWLLRAAGHRRSAGDLRPADGGAARLDGGAGADPLPGQRAPGPRPLDHAGQREGRGDRGPDADLPALPRGRGRHRPAAR